MSPHFAPHATDFYKPGHRPMFPAGTEMVYSNLTNRSDKHLSALKDFDHKTVWFGLQGYVQTVLIDLWNNTFFNQSKEYVIAKIKRRFDRSLGSGAVAVDCFEALHDLGYLPIAIKALPEGSRVDIKVPVLTIMNTHPDFFWLTNYLETQLSAELWKMQTSATIAYEYRRLFEKFAIETGVDLGFVDFQGHDFSFRGMSGIDDAAKTGAGHLLSFKGTDSIVAIDYLEDYYDAADTFVGGSVPASEHSVMCMGGQDGEIETFRRLIKEVYPKGIISIVSDTWDFWQVITQYTEVLKDDILSRGGGGKVVFRPDSGDPVDVVVGTAKINELGKVSCVEHAKSFAEDVLVEQVRENTPHGECGLFQADGFFRFNGGEVYKATVSIDWNRHDRQYYYIGGSNLRSFEPVVLSPEEKGAVECLWDVFGGTVNDKGYKTLDHRVGLIYGDSISLERAEAILEGLKAKGFASDTIVFGIGSYTYQFVTRDTLGSAVKATAGVVNGELREIAKNPKTDNGMKKSAKGLLRVEYENGKFVLYDQQTPLEELQGLLEPVFYNGQLIREHTLQEIRDRLLTPVRLEAAA